MSPSSRPTTTSGCRRVAIDPTTPSRCSTSISADAAGGLPGGPPRPDPAAPLRPDSRLTGAHAAGHLRGPGREPAAGPHGPVDAAAGPRLLHDRLGRARGQRRGRRGAAADRPGAAALPVRRVLPAPAPRQVPGIDPVRDVLLGVAASADEPIAGGRHKVFGRRRAGHHPADLDDRLAPAAGARCRARLRPGGASSACPARGPATRWRSPASATRRRTTPPRSARSTPPATPRTRASRSRCCWSARTTGSASACRPRTGWVAAAYSDRPGLQLPRRRRLRPGRRPTTRPSRRSRWSGPGGARRSCTCPMVRFLGHAGSDAEISLPPARRPRRRPTTATRCWRPPGALVSAGLLHPGRGGGPLRRGRRAGAAASAEQAMSSRPLQRGRGDRPAGPAPPGPGRRTGQAGPGITAARTSGCARSRRTRRLPRTRASRSPWPTAINQALARAARDLPAACACSARTSGARAACTA